MCHSLQGATSASCFYIGFKVLSQSYKKMTQYSQYSIQLFVNTDTEHSVLVPHLTSVGFGLFQIGQLAFYA